MATFQLKFRVSTHLRQFRLELQKVLGRDRELALLVEAKMCRATIKYRGGARTDDIIALAVDKYKGKVLQR